MILKHYGLREQPFGSTPDPQFLFASKLHREALASLLYAVESGRGFTALIAPPGLGKTTLLFHLLGSLRGKAKTAFVFQSQCKPRELLRFLLKEFGVSTPTQDFVAMHHALNDMLAAEAMAGRKCVIVLDEAHNLSDSVLESVRLLSDFETPDRKLLHIIMAGQSELKERLARPSLAQLRQRIGVVCKLAPLPPREIDEYIQHRLKAAGYSGPPLFTPAAIAVIREFSQGIPRNINALCFSAMSLGFALGRTELDAQILEEAVADLSLELCDTQVFRNEPEINDVTSRPTPAPEIAVPADVASSAQPDDVPNEESISILSAAVQVETPALRSVSVEQEAADAATAHAASQTKAKTLEEPARDPLQNIDLSGFALLDGIPSKKVPAREEGYYLEQGKPWMSSVPQPIVAPEPELDVLKRRLANHSYPEHEASAGMRSQLVIVGLVTAVFGAAVLAALLWLRPDTGFAMGKSEPELSTTASPQTIAPAATETPKPKHGASKSPVLITSSALTPVAFSRNPASPSVEETAPPQLLLDDQTRMQQLQGVVALPDPTQPLAPTKNVAENALGAESENINTPLEMTPPVYPESAKQAKLEGTVVLQIVVDKNGKVKRLDRISGDQQLADAAIEAVSRWRYRPTLVNGKRVESFKQVEMKFALGDGSPNILPQQSTQ